MHNRAGWSYQPSRSVFFVQSQGGLGENGSKKYIFNNCSLSRKITLIYKPRSFPLKGFQTGCSRRQHDSRRFRSRSTKLKKEETCRNYFNTILNNKQIQISPLSLLKSATLCLFCLGESVPCSSCALCRCGHVSSQCVSNLLRLASLSQTTRYSFFSSVYFGTKLYDVVVF